MNKALPVRENHGQGILIIPESAYIYISKNGDNYAGTRRHRICNRLKAQFKGCFKTAQNKAAETVQNYI